MNDILSGFFGEQGQCGECQCEIDIDREFCQDCLDKIAEQKAKEELSEAGVTYRNVARFQSEIRKDGEKVATFSTKTAYDEPKATEALAAFKESKDKEVRQQQDSRRNRSYIPYGDGDTAYDNNRGIVW